MTVTMATKKSFEFRMSKKVAELTQVVHMLFTRNHEKEVEMEALKEAYEEEIGYILQDARCRIQELEQKLSDSERKRATDSDRVRGNALAEKTKIQEEMGQTIAKLEQKLADEKRDCQSVRDLLINAQTDIDRLKRNQGDEAMEKSKAFDVKCRELNQMRIHLQNLERALKEKDMKISSYTDLVKNNERLNKDVNRFKELFENGEKTKEDIMEKNKQLEADVKQLKRELAKRLAERNVASAKNRQEPRQTPPITYTDQNEEVEKLKKEILKYKMELSNRENNFNKMFKDKQPVFVDSRRKSRAGGFSLSDGAAQLRYTRERTMHVEPRALESFHDEMNGVDYSLFSPRASASSSVATAHHMPPERLPQLGIDVGGVSSAKHNPSNRVLIKPKPLPRELLSAKPTNAH